MALVTLKDTTESLNIVLAGAVTTNQLEFTVNYADKTASALTPGSNADDTNDTSEVVACSAPGASTVRLVDSVHVYNADTVGATVRLIHKDSDGTDRTFRSQEVAAGAAYVFSSAVPAGLSAFDDSEGDPANVAGTADDGTSGYSARRDHTHASYWVSNLCLNPGFEYILSGTHTSAIEQLNAASSTQNSNMPGWIMFTGAGASPPDITVDQDTTTYQSTSGSDASAKVTVTTLDTGPVGIRQTWGGTDNSVLQYLEELVYQCRGRVLNFFADLKNSHTSVSCRLNITTDGASPLDADSSAHTGTTDWTRIGVTGTIPTDATQIKLQLEITALNAGGDTVNIDNVMVVVSDVALTELPYEPRLPVSFVGPRIDVGDVLSYTTPADTNWHVTGDGTADIDYDYNDNRPAWANAVEILTWSAGAIAAWGQAPNGFSNYQLISAPHGSGGNGAYGYGIVGFGAEGQMQFALYSTSLAGYISNKHWIGEML